MQKNKKENQKNEYKIYLTTKADKQLLKLPQKLHEVLMAKIINLKNNPIPSGSKKLSGREGWRLRYGNYRIIYTIDLKNKEITILSVRHRKEIYRN